MINCVNTATFPARASGPRRFRIAVIGASVVAAITGSVLLVTRDSGEKATTRGITATLPVPGHPGSVVAVPDALWVALNGDPRKAAGDRPLVRLDLATGTPKQTVHVGGEVSSLLRVGERLIASVRPVGDDGFGPHRLVALDWRTGAVLGLGISHLNDTDARKVDGPVDRVMRVDYALWALEVRPGRLLRLDFSTLVPTAAPIRLSNGRTLGLAAGHGYLWVTAADAGDVLRIDPATRAITRVHVGGFPVGIAVTNRYVWFADRSGGNVVRLDPDRLQPIGDPIPVGTKPSWLAVAGDSLFVTDQDAGTIARVDVHSGREIGPPIRIAPAAKDAVAPAIASTGGSVWVSSFESNTITRVTVPTSLAAPSGEVTLAGTGNGGVNLGPTGMGVTDGGVAGTGHFTVTGAINDKGTYIQYRSVKGQIAKIRSVYVGARGTIILVITIDMTKGSTAWTITSGTKSYVGLHGKGTLTVDNYERNPYTFVLKGTVSR
jgi:hypothetical protein